MKPEQERDPVQVLTDAIEWVEKNHPLPRCSHGSALRDGAGDRLEPSCGCREEVVFRFVVGQEVWVRDMGKHGRGGYKIERAVVLEQHHHPGRHPWYPNGEGYSLDGDLWWDCYPGCRVFATRKEAIAARLPRTYDPYYAQLAAEIWQKLNPEEAERAR